jgi:hypothetical protein
MEPGTYLRLRREAAGVAIADVAELQESLEDIETGGAPITVHDATRLRELFPFDPDVLAALCRGQEEPICRVCGCSQYDPCAEGLTHCAWAEDDLCTACRIPVPA